MRSLYLRALDTQKDVWIRSQDAMYVLTGTPGHEQLPLIHCDDRTRTLSTWDRGLLRETTTGGCLLIAVERDVVVKTGAPVGLSSSFPVL